MSKVLILLGDGIGVEIIKEALKVLQTLQNEFGLNIETETALIGGCAYDAEGVPLSETTINLAKASDAILFGAVGGYQWENLDISVRPEKGLLKIRADLDLFANLRPAILYPQLASASTLHADIVSGLDLMIVRELTSGIYFGQPRGIIINNDGEREAFNTLRYTESEVKRIAHSAFKTAMMRGKKLTSVDKANVLEATEMWREIMTEVANDYPEVELSHMYVDNAAMQLVKEPKQFDTIVTTNMFGDILSDCAAMLTGSIGMLPSASLDINNKGMYEPIHGSAPDIAGKNIANPLATILSSAMMLRYSLNQPVLADLIEKAINIVLDKGLRTTDIYTDNTTLVSTSEMGDAVVQSLQSFN